MRPVARQEVGAAEARREVGRAHAEAPEAREHGVLRHEVAASGTLVVSYQNRLLRAGIVPISPRTEEAVGGQVLLEAVLAASAFYLTPSARLSEHARVRSV